MRGKGGALLASLLLHLVALAGVVATMRGPDAVPAGTRTSLVTIMIQRDMPSQERQSRSSSSHRTVHEVALQEKSSAVFSSAPMPAGPVSLPQKPASFASATPATALQTPAKVSDTRRERATDPLEAYRLDVWRRILAARPRNAQGAGRVTVRFQIDHQGRLLSAEIVQSSGFLLLDKLALRAVRAAAPFSAPPAELPASSLTFIVPMDFHG